MFLTHRKNSYSICWSSSLLPPSSSALLPPREDDHGKETKKKTFVGGSMTGPSPMSTKGGEEGRIPREDQNKNLGPNGGSTDTPMNPVNNAGNPPIQQGPQQDIIAFFLFLHNKERQRQRRNPTKRRPNQLVPYQTSTSTPDHVGCS
mmetsp:Transcript_1453/g.3577  ORF Transcript_1453/g.3577 Transcript_1453/m.3577 type:complete len:147 (+) Transcript_1453:436-876(+)